MSYLRTNHILFLSVLLFLLIPFVPDAQTDYEQIKDSMLAADARQDNSSALKWSKEALGISKKRKDSTEIIGNLLQIGKSYLLNSDKDNSLENYYEALRLSEKVKNDSLEFKSLTYLAYFFIQIENTKTAEDYLNRAKVISEKLKSNQYLMEYYTYVGILENSRKDYSEAILAYEKVIELTPQNNIEDKISAHMNISTAYGNSGDLSSTLSHLLEAQELNTTLGNEWFELVLSGQLGRTYLLLGKIDKAIQYYSDGLERSEKIENSDMIRRFQRELARSNFQLGNYKVAYEHYAQFVKELEKSHSLENSNAIAEMSAKYEHEKNQQRIKYLEEQDQLKEEIHQSQIERRNLWILVAAIILIVALIIAIIVFKNQRNKQRLKLALIENQKEVAKQQAELDGQEAERNRLSRELHDGLGGTLSSIKMRLSSKNIEEINPILKDIDAACQDVRNMSHSLSSTFINEIDFHSLLTKLTEEIRVRSALQTNLEFMPAEELNNLETELKHQCYRIIQELTNNVVKHAKASKLTIGLMKNENDVILLVEDDGTGFDATLASDGIGLSNVRKRLEKINGTLDIRSSETEGSTFSISFPFIETYED